MIAAFAIGGLLAGAGVWAGTRNLRGDPPADVVRFAIHDTDKVIVSRAEGDMAFSPDGRTLAFVGFSDGGTRIWLRPVDSLESRPLPGTEGAQVPSWSPDGRSPVFGALGFGREVGLYRSDLDGSAARRLCDVPIGVGSALAGTWESKGVIVFASTPTGVASLEPRFIMPKYCGHWLRAEKR